MILENVEVVTSTRSYDFDVRTRLKRFSFTVNVFIVKYGIFCFVWLDLVIGAYYSRHSTVTLSVLEHGTIFTTVVIMRKKILTSPPLKRHCHQI